MSLNGPLFWWQFRRVRGITVLGLVVALVYTMRAPDVLRFGLDSPAPYFILVHCLLVAWRLGRTEHRSFGFLSTQGYSRSALWLNTMLASAASVLLVWLPPAAAIWSGLRSQYQAGLGNRWFPLLESAERPFAFWCLLGYVVLIPVFHYAWIRGSQSCREPAVGMLLGFCTVLACLSIWAGVRVSDMPPWTQWLMAGGMVVAAASLLIGGRILHRTSEVMR